MTSPETSGPTACPRSSARQPHWVSSSAATAWGTHRGRQPTDTRRCQYEKAGSASGYATRRLLVRRQLCRRRIGLRAALRGSRRRPASMLIRPMPGADRDRLLENLRFVHIEVGNVRSRGYTPPGRWPPGSTPRRPPPRSAPSSSPCPHGSPGPHGEPTSTYPSTGHGRTRGRRCSPRRPGHQPQRPDHPAPTAQRTTRSGRTGQTGTSTRPNQNSPSPDPLKRDPKADRCIQAQWPGAQCGAW